MLEWMLLSKNFPKVPKIKTSSAAKRTKLTAKKVKSSIKRKCLQNGVFPIVGGGVHSTTAPSKRGSGRGKATKKTIKKKKSSLRKRTRTRTSLLQRWSSTSERSSVTASGSPWVRMTGW